MSDSTLTRRLERLFFGHRTLILAVFSLVTVAMLLVSWRGLRIDASFTKQLPTQHEYMRTYLDPAVGEFRGANRVLIALVARDGNMFTPAFFEALRRATDDVLVEVADVVAEELGWSSAQTTKSTEAFRRVAEGFVTN